VSPSLPAVSFTSTALTAAFAIADPMATIRKTGKANPQINYLNNGT
jgi:hypothetical protein